MSTLSVRLPTSIHRQLRALAQKEGVSINQLIDASRQWRGGSGTLD